MLVEERRKYQFWMIKDLIFTVILFVYLLPDTAPLNNLCAMDDVVTHVLTNA